MEDLEKEQIAQQIGKKEEIANAYASVFDESRRDVQIVLEDLIRNGFITKSTFVQGDPYSTALNEGSRRFCLSILNRIYNDPTKQLKLLKGQLNNAK